MPKSPATFPPRFKAGKNADATTPPAGDVDPAVDDSPNGTAVKNSGPAERDLTLDETEKILIDYIGMKKVGFLPSPPASSPCFAGGEGAGGEGRKVPPKINFHYLLRMWHFLVY